MKKLFINIVICFVANMLLAQTSFNSVTTITPSSLPQLNGNIYQRDNTTCLLHGYNYEDMSCETSRESEVVSFAVRNLAVAKYGSWSNAEFTPDFIENRITTTNNIEQNLLSALNVVKAEGIPSISFESYQDEDKVIFDASFNTINYGKLQSASDPNLIKSTLNKGYPVIIYFKYCTAYQRGIEYHNVWDDFIPTSIRSVPEESYLSAIIIGYQNFSVPSAYQNKQCFIMYCPKEPNKDFEHIESSIIYVPFDSVATNIFDYAIVPHSLSPYKYPTEIEGPDYLACTKTYQVSNLPPTATISWRKESSQISLIGSTTSNSVNVSYVYGTQNNSVEPYFMDPTIQVPKIIATITYNGHSLELEKRLYVTNNIAPSVTVQGIMMGSSRLFSGSTYTFEVTNAEYSDDSSIVWDITLPNGAKQYKTGKNIQITPTSSGTLKLNVENIDGCTPNNISSYSYSVMGFGQLQYNNPASETLYVQIVEQNENSRAISDKLNYYDDEYTLELYDKNTTLVRKVRIQPNASQIQIPVSDLMPGYYYLRLVIDNQVVNIEQIIIN